MNAWRGFWAVPAAVIAAGALAIASPSTSVLENLHGVVQYLAASGAPARPLAPKASAAISDDDVAQTGSGSMAMITLADSSQITMASNSTLKLDTFSASQVARAHFVLFNGKMRFKVEHPAGARADYTFTTPTGEIAVRGTEGDIAVDPVDGVRMNVYRLSEGALPVHVTMIDGSQYDIPAGQKIWMRWTSGKLIAKVTPITTDEIKRFEELGPP
jgi:ferric-dicitrate binding protein FerR (iron transport regulator)